MSAAAPGSPIVVGLVGGIASGKSAVAGLFEEQGFVRIDADAEARAVVERDDVRRALRERFGAAAFDADGRLDRPALASIVFADPAARADLEAITHPGIRAAIVDALERALAAGRSVVLDVPLLVEGGLVDRCDEVVFVDVPRGERLRRAQSRGWTAAEFARREAAQAPIRMKKARATATIRNTGSLDRTRERVARLAADWARARTRP